MLLIAWPRNCKNMGLPSFLPSTWIQQSKIQRYYWNIPLISRVFPAILSTALYVFTLNLTLTRMGSKNNFSLSTTEASWQNYPSRQLTWCPANCQKRSDD